MRAPRGGAAALGFWLGLVAILPILQVRAQAQEGAEAAPGPAQQRTGRQARRLFHQGLKSLKVRRWTAAVEAFEASWRLDRRPPTAFNLAAARYGAGQYEKALVALDWYRRLTGAGDPDAQQLAGQIRDGMARVVLVVEPAQAQVLVDDQPFPGEGSRRELWLNPGRRTVRVTEPGYRPWVQVINLRKGERDRTEFEVRLTPARGESPGGDLAGAGGPGYGSESWPTGRDVALGLGVAGGVGLVLAGAFSLAALNRDASDGTCEPSCGPMAYGDRQAARSWGNAATVSLLVGGALLIGGVVVYFIAGEERGGTALWLSPEVGAGTAGLAFGGRL